MNLGQTSVVFRRERSYHGVGPRELKSALQKYARRGDRDKGLWCLVEMDQFALGLGDLDGLARRDGTTPAAAHRRIDALRTNLMNRLVVMMSEEVSVHAPWLPVAARALYERWCAARDAPSARRHLVDLYLLILEADKCRVVSDYRTAFNLAPHYLPDAQRAALVGLHRALLQANDPALYEMNYGRSLDGIGAAGLAARALERVRAGSDEALFWCGRLVEHRDAASGVEALWEGLLATGFAREPVAALRFFHRKMTHREKPIYLYHAVLLVTLRDRIDAARPASLAPRTSVDVGALYAEHTTRPAPTLDAFVFDLHTGARSDEGRTTFALEGAHVENEATRFLVPRYRALYVAFKRALDAWSSGREAAVTATVAAAPAAMKAAPAAGDVAEVESLAGRLGVPVRAVDAAREREVAALPRAQKRTAAAKKAVFVTRDAVYKGPYAAGDAKLRLNLVNTALVACVEGWLGVGRATVVPWRALLRAPDGSYYLEAENLGAGDGGGAWAVVSSKVETGVKVLARGSFIRRVSEFEAEPITAPAGVWAETLQHLYVLYLLGVGDEGSHNVVVAADGRVVGIDLEEFRAASRVPTDALSALFKRVAAAHRAIYPRHLARVRTLSAPLTEGQRAEALALGCDAARLAAVERRAEAFAALVKRS